MNCQSVDLILDSLAMEQYPGLGRQDLYRLLNLLLGDQSRCYQCPHKLAHAVTDGFRCPANQYHNNN